MLFTPLILRKISFQTREQPTKKGFSSETFENPRRCEVTPHLLGQKQSERLRVLRRIAMIKFKKQRRMQIIVGTS